MVQIKNGGMQKEHEKIEPDEFTGNTLGGKFGNTIIRVFKKSINSLTEWFEDRLINFAIGVLVKLEQSGKTILSPLIKELKSKDAIPDFLKPIFDEIEDPKHEIGALLMQSAGGSAIGGIFGAIFDPLMAGVKYQLNKAIRPYKPSIQEIATGRAFGIIGSAEEKLLYEENGFEETYHNLLRNVYKNQIPFNEAISLHLRGEIGIGDLNERIRKLGFNEEEASLLENLVTKIPTISESIVAMFRNEIQQSDLDDIAKKNGIDNDFLKILITANRKIIDLSDIRTIYYRANKDDTWLNENLSKIGYSDDTIEDLKVIFPFYPGVGDLVRFAVREVYYPDYVRKYGLDDEYPPEYEEAAKKAGLPPEQAKNYWRAHWILPSILQGYEMLHRNVIGSEELGDLFKAVDIMPYWREKLEAISYNPLTRVDVRRMYNTGTLGEAEVLEAYKAVGYNDKNAKLMTDFTKNFYQPAEKRLSRTDILDGYKRKFLNQGEATELLEYLGYDPDEIMFYFAKVDHKEAEEDKKEAVALVKDMYKKGIADDNEVISLLTQANVEMAEITYYLDKWRVAKISKPATPAKEDLKNWLLAKIIPREEFIKEMGSLGYANKYINYYLLQYTKKGL